VAGTTRRLSDQLDRGACVLVALVAAAEGEREVVEILLAHSIDQVQQHDIPSPTNV
jgi:transposase-like protein